jgi:alkylation response protein AidB-like acyl-CoA dehydrogenase
MTALMEKTETKVNSTDFFNPYIQGEDEIFYKTVKTFGIERVLPTAVERDLNCEWSTKLWEELSSMGLAGIPVPEKYGGQGGSCLQTCLSLEAFSAGSLDGGFSLSWGAHMVIGTLPILLFGTEEQKQRYLPSLASGEKMAGFGLTEPGSGSDAASMITSAVKTDKGFLMNGSKLYITNGPVGHVFVTMARTKKSRGPMGVSAFLVESTTPGFSVSKVLKKLGHNTSTTAELSFSDMHLPEDSLLGPLDSGFMRIGRATLEWERTVLVVGNVGAMEFSLEQGLRYAREREQFSKPILSFYAIREKLAKNWVFMQAARRYVYFVARQKDKGFSLPLESSLIKLFSSEIAEQVSSESVQLHGGMGYMKEMHVERFYRDCKLGTIGGGTSEIQRSIIASTLRDFKSLQSNLHSAYDEAVRQKAASLAGGLPEYEIVDLMATSIKNLEKNTQKKNNQPIEFAFADLVTAYSVLQVSCYDLAIEHGHYCFEQKCNDFRLLTQLLLHRYLPSFKVLSLIEGQNIKKLIQLFLDLPDPEIFVDKTVTYITDHV